MTSFLTNRDIYTSVVCGIVPRAREMLWIATSDIKDMYVGAGGRDMVPFLEVLDTLVKRGVEVRLIHAKDPGPNWRNDFDRYPTLWTAMERMLCPRVHFKCIIVDGVKAYFGSANLTGAGMGAKSEKKRNFENGVVTDDPTLVEPLVEQFDSVWRNAPAAKPSGSPTSAARSFRVAKVARGCATFAANAAAAISAAIRWCSLLPLTESVVSKLYIKELVVMTIKVSEKDLLVLDRLRCEVCQLLHDIKYDEPINVANPGRILGLLRDLVGVLESSVVMSNPHKEVGAVHELRELYYGEEKIMSESLLKLEDMWRDHIANSESLRDNADLFNMDGFYPFYTQQKVRILFVGREACCMQGKNYITTICPCIKNDNFNGWTVNQYPFHRRQFYLAYGILQFFGLNQREFPKWEDVPWASDMARNIFAKSHGEAINGLDSISWAFINLSKFSNETDNWQTDYSSRYLPFVNDNKNRNYLKKQIRILNPHLIIGANVGELRDMLGYNVCDPTQKACFYYPPTSDGCYPPFLDCYHFAAIKSDQKGFYNPVREVIMNHVKEIEDYMNKNV